MGAEREALKAGSCAYKCAPEAAVVPAGSVLLLLASPPCRPQAPQAAPSPMPLGSGSAGRGPHNDHAAGFTAGCRHSLQQCSIEATLQIGERPSQGAPTAKLPLLTLPPAIAACLLRYG